MSYAFLDLRIGNLITNRVVIRLFDEDAPETCTFFRSLLSHENGYKRTRFQRVIAQFMIQGGDVDMEDDTSIPRGPDKMENLDRVVDKPGLVGLARKHVAESNAQFFITLGNAQHLRGVHTIFGQVVKGMEFVKKISEVEVDDDDVPVSGSEVTIANCGELQQRKPWQSSPQPTPEKSVSRGRKWRRLQPEEDEVEVRKEEPSRREKDSYTRDRSPLRRDEDRRPRSRTPNSDGDTQRRHRHHHHHRQHRRHRKSLDEDDQVEKNGHSSAAKVRERSRSPQRRKQDSLDASHSRDTESTRRQDYIPRRQERRESNYGRLGFVSEHYDDRRDNEYHLRDVDRRWEEDRENVEPTVKFKGRGAMKFLENRRDYRY